MCSFFSHELRLVTLLAAPEVGSKMNSLLFCPKEINYVVYSDVLLHHSFSFELFSFSVAKVTGIHFSKRHTNRMRFTRTRLTDITDNSLMTCWLASRETDR